MTCTPTPKPIQTPWGVADYQHVVAPGLVFYGTSSHGGYHLSDVRMKVLVDCYAFEPRSGVRGWFEEDGDWAAALLPFADEVDDGTIDDAIFCATNPPYSERWADVQRWLRSDHHRARLAREAAARFGDTPAFELASVQPAADGTGWDATFVDCPAKTDAWVRVHNLPEAPPEGQYSVNQIRALRAVGLREAGR